MLCAWTPCNCKQNNNSCLGLQRLWAYSKDAVVLHLAYLNNSEKGAQTHSVLVTDIPGTAAGCHNHPHNSRAYEGKFEYLMFGSSAAQCLIKTQMDSESFIITISRPHACFPGFSLDSSAPCHSLRTAAQSLASFLLLHLWRVSQWWWRRHCDRIRP